MATYTSNLNLKKPNSEDFYNIADFNGNADILDTEVSKKVDKVTGGTEGNFAKLDANGGIADSGTNATNITNHIATDITSSNGVHGIRYNDNKIQYYDNNTWNNAKTATHLYLSDWVITFGPVGGTYQDNKSACFKMITSYEPTATNLNTFKQMVGANVGTLNVLAYLNPVYGYFLGTIKNSNNVLSGTFYDEGTGYSTNFAENASTTITITKNISTQIF